MTAGGSSVVSPERWQNEPKLYIGTPYDGAVQDKDGKMVLPWMKPHPAYPPPEERADG